MKQRSRSFIAMLTGGALLILLVDVFIAGFRLIGLPRGTAIYAGLLTFTLLATLLARHWFKPRLLSERLYTSGETIMPKRSLLPPPTDAQKRDMTVNVHFNSDDYERLKVLAVFSRTSVANLLHYVTVNTTLPEMEREMNQMKSPGLAKSMKSEPPPAPPSLPALPSSPVKE